jgi:hypothetical protein
MSKFVLVETISQFRERYVIEVPDNHNDGEYACTAIQWAEDTVTTEEMQEFSQKWLGEVITGSREVTREEILTLCDVDNDYCKSWDDEQKLKVFVTPIDYKRDY